MKSILVVEDNLDTQELLSMFLMISGYKVTVASGRDEALKLSNLKNHRVIIVDLRMPGMTLVDFITSTKAARPDVQFILASALPPENTAAEARKFGIPYWLTKPFLPDELLEVVAKASKD